VYFTNMGSESMHRVFFCVNDCCPVSLLYWKSASHWSRVAIIHLICIYLQFGETLTIIGARVRRVDLNGYRLLLDQGGDPNATDLVNQYYRYRLPTVISV
jgi:hypothetical protein